MARVSEINFNGTNMRVQFVVDKSYKDFLKEKGVPVIQIKEEKMIAMSLATKATCEVYKYVNPETNLTQYAYEYIEKSFGDEGFGCYVAVTQSDEDLNIFKLYDAIMSK